MGNERNESLTGHRLSLVQSMYNMLMTRTAGRTVDEAEFAEVRISALRDSELPALLPSWLREVRTPRDWSIYSEARFGSNGQAREFLRRDFAPVFGHLEGIEVQRDTSPILAKYGGRPYRYPGSGEAAEPETFMPGNRVFLVHGHDQQPRNAVEAYLRRLGLEPIVLGDEPSRGRTIIEKLEAYDAVDYAVVILTPDDFGGSAAAPDAFQPRARQNVILELGYFVGRLGRDFVAALLVEDIELPSDVRGVAYIPYQHNDLWKGLLLRELRHAQLPLNLDAI